MEWKNTLWNLTIDSATILGSTVLERIIEDRRKNRKKK
jgi:hypothetical protein